MDTFSITNARKNVLASILTFSRRCKFQAEFVNVIVIDNNKITNFRTMHTTFEFHGRDLSCKIH